jgi:hypothetical protein
MDFFLLVTFISQTYPAELRALFQPSKQAQECFAKNAEKQCKWARQWEILQKR